MPEIKTIRPQKGMQEKIVQSNCDVIFAGGSMNSGKTFGVILSIAEMIQDPKFCAVFLRRTLNETKVGGGLFQEMKEVYKDEIVSAKESENPRIIFRSGAFCDFSHIQDETPSKLLERIRGWQYPFIYFDEGTSYEWSTFRLLFSRNRGKSVFKPRVVLTCNPKKRHWLRSFMSDYIDHAGYIREDWDGKVRYFFIKGKKVGDVVWGDSYEEVYEKCRIQINDAIEKTKVKGIGVNYKSFIKSFVFYKGSTAENRASIGQDASYLGSVAAMGATEYRANLLGCWNVDETDEDSPIKYDAASDVFVNDPCMNNDKWITVDLANEGRDNTVILAWDGFHVIDVDIIMTGTPKGNAEHVKIMAQKHNIADEHIIYDAIGSGIGFGDWIPDAIPFYSYNAPIGAYSRSAANLKDMCYLRLVYMINNRRISVSEAVADTKYIHKNISQDILFRNEFEEECAVVRFKDLPSGKKRLFNKKEMNAMLGKGRSMDVLDPFAMRMYPILESLYGDEILHGLSEQETGDDETGDDDIYQDNFWA